MRQIKLKIDHLAGWWCRVQHDSLMWPSHGEYQCMSCGRRYEVPWESRRLEPLMRSLEKRVEGMPHLSLSKSGCVQ